MEKFETNLDNHKIKITAKVSSDALLDGSNKIFITIYHEDKPKRWRKIIAKQDNINKFSAEIVKSRLQKRPIVKIRTNYIVDDKDLKKQIAKTSTVKYTFNDPIVSDNYVSKYQINDLEYDLGSDQDETFSITKRVKISLK